jgi:hypothetical protein
MSSLCPSALASLDDSLAVAYESLRKLEAAESVDVAEMIRQIETAAESAQKLRALVSTELPHASWENREELDALIGGDPQKSNGKWYQSLLRRQKASAAR